MGGGKGREAVRGFRAELGEIPAASAGMTDLACAGGTEIFCAGVTDLACTGGTEIFCAGVTDLGGGGAGEVRDGARMGAGGA